MVHVLKVELYQIVEEQDGSVEARQLRSKLEETYIRMRESMKIKQDK